MKTFFLTAWLRKGWSCWGFQPHNHKINGCLSKLQSEPTAGLGGNCPVHPIIFIFGWHIVAAFKKQYGHVKRQKPSYLFPVLLYIWNSSFRNSVETLLKQFHPTGTFFFLFSFFFLRKLLVILRAYMGSPIQCYIPNSEGFGACCIVRGQFVDLAVKQTGAMFFKRTMRMVILTI